MFIRNIHKVSTDRRPSKKGLKKDTCKCNVYAAETGQILGKNKQHFVLRLFNAQKIKRTIHKQKQYLKIAGCLQVH